MDNSQLNQIVGQGTRICLDNDKDLLWVINTPTEQQIIIFDTKVDKATSYVRIRPNRESEWYDWKAMEEVNLQ